MDAFHVRPGKPLRGTVAVSGAKNSALKLAAASLLAEGTSILHNVPAIADMGAMAEVLRHLGAGVHVDGGTYRLDVPADLDSNAPEPLVRRLRASIVVLGPLLARCGLARVAMPGGCDLGSRGIDMHLAGLARLGAEITYTEDYVEARSNGRLHGTDIELPYASVGATENILMAAATARGVTTIHNAAREPEIVDLAAFLNAMGADVQGAGSSEVRIVGTDGLGPATHRVVGDRIEAGTFAIAAALTGGEVRIEGVRPDHLRLPLEKLRRTGAVVDEAEDSVTVSRDGPLTSVDVVTLPFPGFPTDLGPQMLVLLTQAAGTAILTENVFELRFRVVEDLKRMGADIGIEAHHAVVRGPSELRGTTVRAPDLRGGAALVLAGLAAEGETVVTEPQHIDRGYADFAVRLGALGADVRRVVVEPSGPGSRARSGALTP
jgi:UDP-N-acetylglucosamine 1-carboxyvinyltransferase